MLPQHGGVPNFSLRIPGPFLLMLAIILVTGGMLALSFHLTADDGDLAVQNQVKLTLIVTGLLSFFVLLAGTSRWWHPHLWRHGNSQQQHRHRRGHHSGRHRRHG